MLAVDSCADDRHASRASAHCFLDHIATECSKERNKKQKTVANSPDQIRLSYDAYPRSRHLGPNSPIGMTIASISEFDESN